MASRGRVSPAIFQLIPLLLEMYNPAEVPAYTVAPLAARVVMRDSRMPEGSSIQSVAFCFKLKTPADVAAMSPDSLAVNALTETFGNPLLTALQFSPLSFDR